MNIATLSKIKLLSTSNEKTIGEIKTVLARMRFQGHFSSSFYLSDASPDELYLLSFWQSLEAAQTAFERLKQGGTAEEVAGLVNISERQFFRLAWEYRLLPTTPQASLLRLITYPPHFSENQIHNIMNLQRQRRTQTPGMMGVWFGYSLNNPWLVLNQIDWINLEAQQSFFDQPNVREALARWQSQGITIEYASFNLKGTLQIEEVVN